MYSLTVLAKLMMLHCQSLLSLAIAEAILMLTSAEQVPSLHRVAPRYLKLVTFSNFWLFILISALQSSRRSAQRTGKVGTLSLNRQLSALVKNRYSCLRDVNSLHELCFCYLEKHSQTETSFKTNFLPMKGENSITSYCVVVDVQIDKNLMAS